MSVDETNRKYYSDLLENIYKECHTCRHLWLDYEYYEDLNDEFPCFECIKDQWIHIDEYNPRQPCKYREEVK